MQMKRSSVISAGMAVVAGAILSAGAALAAGDAHGPEYVRQPWTFAGFRGYYDNAQLQRGFQVYREVCSSCHGLKRIAFRNLAETGGPQFPDDQMRSVAAAYQIVDGPNDSGKMYKRPGRPSDAFPSPFTNEQEARSANNGAYPPDLSIIAKARGIDVERPFYKVPLAIATDVAKGYQEAGADYIYALLTGYKDAARYTRTAQGKLQPLPAGTRRAPGMETCVAVEPVDGKPDVCSKLQDGMNYNTHFPGYQIGMAQPLQDGQVTYSDGATGTIDQYARDVTAFLSWASDPHLESRKRIGMLAMFYLLITTVLLYFGKKRMWSKIPH
jgi:ubiquinol-cytochrome c reductase cytochrome c1 subunit